MTIVAQAPLFSWREVDVKSDMERDDSLVLQVNLVESGRCIFNQSPDKRLRNVRCLKYNQFAIVYTTSSSTAKMRLCSRIA
jgi:hypothetical protein